MAQGTTWLDTLDQDKVEAALVALREQHDYQDLMGYAGGDERFALWLAQVNRRMAAAVGLGFTDIADWTWRDAFDGGQPPREAAREALEADDTYAMIFGGE